MKIIVNNTTCNKYLITPSSQTFAPKILLLIIFLIVVVKCTMNTPVYAQDMSEVPNVKKGYSTTTVDKYMPSGATENEPPLILPPSDGMPVRELDGSLPVDLEGDQDKKQNVFSETSIKKSIPVTYDIETGEEIINTQSSNFSNSNDVSIHEQSNKIPKNNYMNGGRGEEIDSLNQTTQDEPCSFTGLSLVPAYSLTSYPYRVAVKIKGFETDTTGNHWYFSCSGTLIDPTHVITAGHCVYSHGDSSAIFNDWAEAIIIVPAYRETSSTSNPWADVYWDSSGNPQFPNYDDACRDEPYGCAKAIQMHAFSGWTDYEDFDYDIAVIDLDRPVGSLSGWAGYGWNSSCSHFTNNFFRQSGYPAESPYDGGDMYTFYGDFDSCESYGNQIRYYGPAWKGQSGSGAIYDPNSCPNCQVNAILSNGDFAKTFTDDVRLTENSYTSIRGVIDADTYSSVDLVPINVRASSSVVAGQRITGMDYLVHNYSNTIYNGTLSVNVYLSTDDNITSSDTLIQTQTVTTTLEPKSSIRVAASTGPLVPSGFAGGTYYLGIIIENSDANTDNNDTDGQDTAIVTVTENSSICSQTNMDACVTMVECQSVGGYWYDDQCHSEVPCTSFGDCYTEEYCGVSGFYWYDGKCNAEPSCRPDNLSACTSALACGLNGGYWYDNVCNASPKPAPSGGGHNAVPSSALSIVDFPTSVTPSNYQVQVGNCNDVVIQPTLAVPSSDVGKTATLIMYIYLPDANFGMNVPSKTKVLTSETKFDLLSNAIDFSDGAGLNVYIYYGYMLGGDIKYNAYSIVVGSSCSNQVPDCGSITDKSSCNANANCEWQAFPSARCILKCSQFTDEAACNAGFNGGCGWSNTAFGDVCAPK